MVTDPRPPAEEQVRPGLTLAVICIGYAMVVVDTTIVNVALPAIGRDLHTGLDALQWVVDGYVLVLACLLLSGGTLVDRWGTLRVFRSGVVLFTVASALCGIAPDIAFLVAARLLQGLAAAMLMPASMALLAQTFPDSRRRARAVALFTTAAGSPQAFGPVLGGLLVSTIGWRSIFFINLPIGAVTLLMAARGGIPRKGPDRTRALDLPGQAAVVVTMAAFTAALIQGHAQGWTAPLPLTADVVAVVGAFLFVLRQRRAAAPMLPASLIRAPRLFSHVNTGLLLFAAYYGLVFALSIYLQQVRYLSALETGLQFLPSALPIFLLPVLTGRLTTRWGARPVVAVGLCLAAAGALCLLTVSAGGSVVALSLSLALLGCGVGLTVGPQITLVIGGVPSDQAGIASGLLNAGRQTGYVLGVAVLGSIADSPVGLSALHTTALVAAGVVVVALATVRRSRADHPSEPAPDSSEPTELVS